MSLSFFERGVLCTLEGASNTSEALFLEKHGQRLEGARLEAFTFFSVCLCFAPVGDGWLFRRCVRDPGFAKVRRQGAN